MKRILLTGCTGLIGRYLLRDLLVAGIPCIAVARPTRDMDVNARIERIVTYWEEMLGRPLSRPVCVAGDVLEPGLGLSADDRNGLCGRVDAVLHNAGNVTFHGSGTDGEPWRTNVTGTNNLIHLCDDLGIRECHHVSTAYVCGDRSGVVFEEDLDLAQGFDSDYERSKLEAEGLIRKAGFDRLSVYRPSSVTGDSQTGYTSTYHGVYLVAQFTHMAQQRAGGSRERTWHHPVRLYQSGSETHHLVPVDAVSRAIATIASRYDLPSRTYHLVPPRPVSSAEIEAALADYFGYHGVEFVGPDARHAAPHDEMERLFYEAMSRMDHRFFLSDPAFDHSNTRAALTDWPWVSIDHAYLVRIFDFAVRHRFGRGRARV